LTIYIHIYTYIYDNKPLLAHKYIKMKSTRFSRIVDTVNDDENGHILVQYPWLTMKLATLGKIKVYNVFPFSLFVI